MDSICQMDSIFRLYGFNSLKLLAEPIIYLSNIFFVILVIHKFHRPRIYGQLPHEKIDVHKPSDREGYIFVEPDRSMLVPHPSQGNNTTKKGEIS